MKRQRYASVYVDERDEHTDLWKLKIPQLKKICLSKGLHISGTKADLVARLGGKPKEKVTPQHNKKFLSLYSKTRTEIHQVLVKLNLDIPKSKWADFTHENFITGEVNGSTSFTQEVAVQHINAVSDPQLLLVENTSSMSKEMFEVMAKTLNGKLKFIWLDSIENDDAAEGLLELVKSSPHLVGLRIIALRMTKDIFSAILDNAPNLQYFSSYHNGDLASDKTDDHVKGLATKCPHLKMVTGNFYTSGAVMMGEIMKLRDLLEFEPSMYVRDDKSPDWLTMFEQLLQCNPNIVFKRFTLSDYVPHAKSADVVSLSKRPIYVQRLKHLYLSDIHLNDEALSAVKAFVNLIDLDLSSYDGRDKVNDKAYIDATSTLKKLQRLSLSGLPLEEASIAKIISQLPDLKILDLRICAGTLGDYIFFQEALYKFPEVYKTGLKIYSGRNFDPAPYLPS
eukprot:TRINITY_DN5504_c0_g1_i1.p1 TRINITY_DN5504_c0_g1~~TRINITY_DN5504_c0_g1_i1.p1  ORF type:complete len:451 (-),score=99.22 TRINITY_DN5504_c0_g1_i1:81-1433(-)